MYSIVLVDDHAIVREGFKRLIEMESDLDVVAECRSFEDSFVSGELYREHLQKAGGYRYLNARRPELYGEIIGRAHAAHQQVVWLNKKEAIPGSDI